MSTTGQPFAYAGDDPVNGSDPSGLEDDGGGSYGGEPGGLAIELDTVNNASTAAEESYEYSVAASERAEGIDYGAQCHPGSASGVVQGGENAYTAYGRAVHAGYDYGPGFEPEFKLENGQRADAVNLETREVLELKPNNPSAISRGLRQVQGYAQQLNKEFPGTPFTYKVVTYDRP